MLHMIVEQTHSYPMRMEYNPATNQFTETGYKSLQYERGFTKPYGWIKESGTPPSPPLGLHSDDRTGGGTGRSTAHPGNWRI